MAIRNLKNFVKVTVSTGYSDTATSIVLQSGDGAKCPDTPFLMVWWNVTDYPDPTDDPNAEIVLVTNRSTDTLTVVRQIEGTGASTKNTASKTYLMSNAITAFDLRHLTQGGKKGRSVPALSEYSRSLLITNMPDWTPDGGLSGILYNARRGTLMFLDQTSTAGAGNIFETNLEGRLIRTIDMTNWDDTEDFCWLGGTWFAVIEEDVTAGGPSRITICEITDAATTLNRTAAGNTTYDLTGLPGIGDQGNLGGEWVSYDPDRDLIYFGYEKPASGVWYVYSMNPRNGDLAIVCSIYQSISVAGVATDISSCHYDPISQNLYLLSDESDKVILIDLAGNVLEQLAITSFTQPEGLCFTPNLGHMFICGEIDEFGRYEAQTQIFDDPAKESRLVCWNIKNPATGGVTGPRIPFDWIPLRLDAHVIGGTSVTFNIEERTAPGTSGTNLMSSDLVATTSGAEYEQAFSNNLIAKENWLHIDISAVSGSVTELSIALLVRPR